MVLRGNRDQLALAWPEFPAEIQLETTCYVSLQELAAISDTEPYGKDAHHELKFRVNGLFWKWLLDEVKTWEMMDRTQSAMSGSAALYVCSPSDWTPGDLDFYCPVDRLDEVMDFFKTQQYVDPNAKPPSATGEEPDEYPSKGIMKRVITMIHTVHDTLKINIIESGMPCAEAPIFAFHSTLVMNMITAKGVVCFYPEWTLKGIGAVNFPAGFADWAKHGKKDRAAHAKYRDRGYTLHVDCAKLHLENESECDACSYNFRTLQDGTLAMPFERGEAMEPLTHPYTWSLGSPPTEATDWVDRGTLVFCDDPSGDRFGHVYNGMLKMVWEATSEEEAE